MAAIGGDPNTVYFTAGIGEALLHGPGQWRCRLGRRRRIGHALISQVFILPFKLN
jgi:hypothetical protein